MEGLITESEVALVDAVAAQLRTLGIAVQDGDSSAPWFPNLLVCIMNSTLREYQHSKIGLKKHTPLLAWACRNLLELDVLTKFVLQSEENARRFIGHRLVDGIDIFQQARSYQLFHEPGSSTPAIDETIRMAEEKKASENIHDTGFLSVAKLAGSVGMSKEYSYMNKVTSKLVHPTAWSVLAMNDEGEFAFFKSIFFFAGGRYLSEIHEAIKRHVDVYGLQPS